MLKRLLPKEYGFFDFFEQHNALTIQGCRELLVLMSNEANVKAQAARIKQIEHETDVITHRCIEALHKTFITPMDRQDIHRLIKRLDDVIDSVDAAASRIVLYEIEDIRSEAKELSELLVRATSEIQQALKHLRDTKNATAINERCIAIYQLENDADVILRSALVRLFKEVSDAALLIKWKEIFEHLEKATDRCEDVANIIQGVVIEAS
jgi:predicted phosphate transport protein (TIGR00153 family)